jgi:nitroreductase
MAEVSSALSRADVELAVRMAVRAPSIHNTQPWRWVFRAGRLELRADESRQLRAVDPDARGVLVSCGAALELARLGFALAGWATEVDRVPEPAQPHLLARIRPVRREQPDELTRQRGAAAERRHTERRPFRPDPVPEALVDQLAAVAADDGQAYAWAVEHADQRLDLAVVFSWADSVEAADPAYRTELASWTREADSAARDGVPAESVPHVPADAPRHADVPVRSFEAGIAGDQQLAEPVDEQPAYIVIFTTRDDAEARLRAGEAYLRLSVEAERLGLGTSALTQAVDMPAVRARFRMLMDWADYPQMVLRAGWPGPGAAPPPTPRRLVSEVLTVED